MCGMKFEKIQFKLCPRLKLSYIDSVLKKRIHDNGEIDKNKSRAKFSLYTYMYNSDI